MRKFQVIGISGSFPGPIVNVTTNWNVVINVKNHLDEPLLVTWCAIYLFIFVVIRWLQSFSQKDCCFSFTCQNRYQLWPKVMIPFLELSRHILILVHKILSSLSFHNTLNLYMKLPYLTVWYPNKNFLEKRKQSVCATGVAPVSPSKFYRHTSIVVQCAPDMICCKISVGLV